MLVLLALAVPVLFLWLGANSIWDANEAFYVDTPRQMVLTGDYITPVFNGANRLNKPVLSYWIVAGLYRVLGVSVTAERVGIACGVLGIALAAFLIGRALRSTATGVLAALMIVTAPPVVMWGRRIFIDVYITMFMSLVLACFVMAERDPHHRRRWLLLMYVAMGLGVLTKGPVAIVLPAVVSAIWLTWERRWADVRRMAIVPGLFIVGAIVVPWYALLYARHGWAPITGFFVGENLDRFTTSMQPDARAFWFYLPVLFTDLFPWAPLFAVPLVTAWKRASASDADASAASVRRLLWTWVVVIVCAFSCSQTKQDLYIFPVVAAVAALTADAVAGASGPRRAWLIGLAAVSAIVTAAAGWAIVRYFGSGGYYALDGARVAGTLLAVGGVAAAVVARRRLLQPAVAVLAVIVIAFNYVFVARILPSVERLKPVVPLANVFLARASPGARLGSFELMLPSLVYYAGRPVHVIESLDDARTFYGSAGAWAIMNDDRFEAVRGVVPGVCVATRHPRLDPQFGDVLAGRPPEDVLLVTNECGARSTN